MRFISGAVALAAVVAVAWVDDIPGRVAARLLPGNTILQARTDPVAADISSAYPTTSAKVVMLGDSLTDSADWAELLPGVDVVNRGLAGDTVTGMLARVDAIKKLHPGRVLVMAGINDLSAGKPPSAILPDYRRLVLELQAAGAEVTIQSTLHVAHDRTWPGVQRFRNYRRNASIAELNDGLRKLAAETGAGYLDLNAIMAPTGEMPEELTIEGTHLGPAGYRLWSGAVRQELAEDPTVAGDIRG